MPTSFSIMDPWDSVLQVFEWVP